MIQIIYMGSVMPMTLYSAASQALPAEAILHKIIISTATGLAAPIQIAIGMCDATNGDVANMEAVDWITRDIGGGHTIQLYGQCDMYIDRIIGDCNRSIYVDCDNQSAAPASILALYAMPDQCYG